MIWPDAKNGFWCERGGLELEALADVKDRKRAKSEGQMRLQHVCATDHATRLRLGCESVPVSGTSEGALKPALHKNLTRGAF